MKMDMEEFPTRKSQPCIPIRMISILYLNTALVLRHLCISGLLTPLWQREMRGWRCAFVVGGAIISIRIAHELTFHVLQMLIFHWFVRSFSFITNAESIWYEKVWWDGDKNLKSNITAWDWQDRWIINRTNLNKMNEWRETKNKKQQKKN